MKRTHLLMAGLLVLATASAAAQAGLPGALRGRELADARHPLVLTSDRAGAAAKAGADTLCLLGDGGDARGDFETPQGTPSWDGWTGVDLTQKTESAWHVDTYHAADLDPGTPGNHAWWCGAAFESCGDGDPEGGYGNNYDELLEWWGEVPEPGAAATARLTAVLNHDCEPGYDYLYLQVETAAGLQVISSWNGKQDSVLVDVSRALDSADYVPHPDTGQPAVHFRFFFESDGGWSDQDCSWPTVGAAQVDLIRVFLDQGAGEVQSGQTETCEPGDPLTWRTGLLQGVGDFAHVWPLLDDLDPCQQNRGPQVAFIDDGNVVPGTGGYSCTTWCYGPGGHIVNPEGGLAGPDWHLHNEIWSPILEWPGFATGASSYDGALFEFTVYRHEQLVFGPSPGMFFVWHVNSSADGYPGTNPGDPPPATGWTGWMDTNFVFYGGPDYVRFSNVVTSLLLPGRTHVQLALGAFELGFVWGFMGTDGTPAPYFDDVRLCAYRIAGPTISTREIDIAQDGFPAVGALDCASPCDLSVRFDMARNVSPWGVPINQPGDSLVFDVVAVKPGTALAARPELVYRLDPNPLFDACRSSGLPPAGAVAGDSCRTVSGNVVPGRWAFDLPDTGFFFPGDVIHYYLRAADTAGGLTTLPGDTSGFSLFPGDPGHVMLRYPSSYTVRALPSLDDLATCGQPRLLWWNDFADRGLEAEWMHAWHAQGYTEGADFDVYYTNGPTSGVGNGLGGRATASQLLGYDVIAYASGDLSAFTITHQDFDYDPGDDVGVLDAWLRTGGRGMLLTGNGLASDLNEASSAGLAFENSWLQVEVVADDHAVLLGRRSPTAAADPAVPGNPVLAAAGRWTALGHCNPGLGRFDVVNAEGVPGRIAQWLDPDCAGGQYPHAAAVYNHHPAYDDRIVYLPYDLGYVVADLSCGGGGGGRAVRAALLEDVLRTLGLATAAPVVWVPEATDLAVRGYPNPFNPRVRIEYVMPRPGQMNMVVHNVRGERVRVLRDEKVPAGPGHVIWDGTDSTGAPAASGVYFCRTVAAGKEVVQKLMLVR